MIARQFQIFAVLWLAPIIASCGGDEAGQREEATSGDRKAMYYKSPMDPSFVSKKPGKDAMGMDLVPVYEGDPGSDLSQISLSGQTIQRMGVRIAKVEKRELVRLVRALGHIEFDEARVSKVNVKFDGWIEKIWANETGKLVEEGARLFSVYSPELVATQEEYVQILNAQAAGPHSAHLVRSARQRLLQYDVPLSFVKRLEKTRKPQRTVTIRSPQKGYVVHKSAFEGSFVAKGANLYTLADLDALWVIADVFEFDAPWVFPGQKATVELDYLPGQIQEASVDYVYPTLNAKQRTLQVRLVLPNPEVAVKPGMFATVRIHTTPAGATIVVPSEAVIHSGERNVAFVSLGEGRFEPRELKLGVLGDEDYQVLQGLEEGEEVVVSGQFLLDSESRLKEAVKKMLGGNVTPSSSGPPSKPVQGEQSDMKGMDMKEANDAGQNN
jgi:Cu(I)/Ag(I) efflux system membrane fusion protein/cobalt-zinc-cadmium efflux system membrane fusion protein